MGTTLRFRLFGIGRMPAPLRPETRGLRPLAFHEGIRVIVRANGRAPGAGIAYGFYRTKSGAFYVCDDRIVASVSGTTVVDVPFASQDPSGAAQIKLEPAGLVLAIDLARAVPEANGQFSLEFGGPIPDSALAGLPSHCVSFHMPPETVVDLLRRRKTL